MKKIIFISLVCLSLVLLLVRFGAKPVTDMLGYQSKAGIKITSKPQATVFINGIDVGKTPYQDENLKAGEYLVTLSENEASWEGRVNITPGTMSVVNRELGLSIASSSGEVLTLNKGSGVIVTSSAGPSDLEIDGKLYGKTPLAISDLSPGEHTFLIGHENYLKRSVRASLPKGLALYIDVDLALTEADLSPINIPSPALTKKVVVKNTSLGFLRVRSKPSISSLEVGKVSSGESLDVIEEMSGWIKVRLSNGVEGYVSAGYVKKQT